MSRVPCRLPSSTGWSSRSPQTLDRQIPVQGVRIIRDNFWNGEEWNGRGRGRGRFGTWCYSRASLFGTADGATVPTGQLLGVAIPPAGGELISAWDWGRRDWGWD